MMQVNPSGTIELNEHFALAADYVMHTACHLFLTGRAGTGKTTFLRHVKEVCTKRMAVVAPTGVAAINAGGATIHSFFQIPPGTFLPAATGYDLPADMAMNGNSRLITEHELNRNHKISADRLKVMRRLELLIIDEISMVRADLLDAIDATLRSARQNQQPFGGVQLLLIGDLFQLPPVTRDGEEGLLQRFYESPYFFSALVLKRQSLIYLELKTIYRQKEQRFIDLLNAVRNSTILPAELDELNQHYQQAKKVAEGVITLTSHNAKADAINQAALAAIKAPVHSLEADVQGDFNDSAAPAERVLQLKVGAQVMFVKNDTAHGRFYNGQIGRIEAWDEAEAMFKVVLPNKESLWIGREVWRNIRYRLNESSNKIEENILGSFTQYPLRLAWAITIHKSQGLTFDQLAIDAAQSFAPGQVYVALSRCTSLEGLHLLSPLNRQTISVDSRIVRFAHKESHLEWLKEQLPILKKAYAMTALVNSFTLFELEEGLDVFMRKMERLTVPADLDHSGLQLSLQQRLVDMQAVMEKFTGQLAKLLDNGQEEQAYERVGKSIAYFGEQLTEQFYKPVHAYFKQLVESKQRVKQLTALTGDLLNAIILTGKRFYYLTWLEKNWDHLPKPQWVQVPVERVEKKSGQVPKKGDSLKESLHWYQQGKTVADIAELRRLSPTTIESHLSHFVEQGTLNVLEFMDAKTYRLICTAIPKGEANNLTSIKQHLPEDISYGQIRMALAGWNHSQRAKEAVAD